MGADQSAKGAKAAAVEGVSAQAIRRTEALLFAAATPLLPAEIARVLPGSTPDIPNREGAKQVEAVLHAVQALYAPRGVNLVETDGRWQFRTAPDMAEFVRPADHVSRKLTRAAYEVLAIVAYHQPVTRAEIEAIRGVSISHGVLETLIDAGFVRPRGRRRSPGKPLLLGTTNEFLVRFGLASLQDLPALGEILALTGNEGMAVPLAEFGGLLGVPFAGESEIPLEEDVFEQMQSERLEREAEHAPLAEEGEETGFVAHAAVAGQVAQALRAADRRPKEGQSHADATQAGGPHEA